VTQTLTTVRLKLQPVSINDLDERVACMAEPQVNLHFGGKPMSRHDCWIRLLSQIGHWHVFGYGYWTARSHDGRYVGNIGFSLLERGVTPDFGDAPELGYILSSWAHGQGFASEALHGAHAWLYANVGRRRTVAMISPDNTPSIRLANRFGYTEYARSTFKEEPMALFERLL
jgi:RimJ/RimL family protein N-acetyltransferase